MTTITFAMCRQELKPKGIRQRSFSQKIWCSVNLMVMVYYCYTFDLSLNIELKSVLKRHAMCCYLV